MITNIFYHRHLMLIIVWSIIFYSCNKEDNSLAPYAGTPALSNLVVEEGSFNPKVTWVGGEVSVLGVNKGSKAALDSSLVWLIHSSSNNILYPVKFGKIPSGAQDITSQFGGVLKDSLDEDEEYTFWVMKAEVWNQAAANPNKEILSDSVAGSAVVVSGDTIMITPFSFTRASKKLNVYINILSPRSLGPLADLTVETTTLNIPRIRWKIKAAGVTDTLIAAIGLAKGSIYDFSGAVWEVYSVRDSSGTSIYARDNVISGPVLVGESFPNTKTFVEFKMENFERNNDYNIWIADKTWDKVNRQRFTRGYAYITFRVE